MKKKHIGFHNYRAKVMAEYPPWVAKEGFPIDWEYERNLPLVQKEESLMEIPGSKPLTKKEKKEAKQLEKELAKVTSKGGSYDAFPKNPITRRWLTEKVDLEVSNVTLYLLAFCVEIACDELKNYPSIINKIHREGNMNGHVKMVSAPNTDALHPVFDWLESMIEEGIADTAEKMTAEAGSSTDDDTDIHGE